MQLPVRHTVRDRLPSQPQCGELSCRDHAVLPRGQSGDPPPDGHRGDLTG
jgi:hypothetical protein